MNRNVGMLVRLIVVGCLAFTMHAARLSAQSSDPVAAGLLPPLVLPNEDSSIKLVAGGVTVSQPLTPVGPQTDTKPIPQLVAPPEIVSETTTTVIEEASMQPAKPRHGIASYWPDHELLLWWTKAHPLPALAVLGGTDAQGRSSSQVLVGNRSLDHRVTAGGRFTIAWALNEEENAGLETRYLFLASRTDRVNISSDTTTILGRPYRNAISGDDEILFVGGPGNQIGNLAVSTTTRLSGWEMNAVGQLAESENSSLTGIVGYRYLGLHEGVRIEQYSLRIGSPSILAGIADDYATRTSFHGAQLGVVGVTEWQSFSVRMRALVGLGQSTHVLKVAGQSNIIAVQNGFPQFASTNAGVLATGADRGRRVESGFAVLPEMQLQLGYQLGSQTRLYVGYQLLYLNEGIRPGDQIDTRIVPQQIGVVRAGGPPSRFGELTARGLKTTDFFAQGLSLSLECRY